MKKIFTLMWAVVCAALTIVSCTPDSGDDNGVTKTSKITVSGAPEANLAPEAGELSLGYAIENPTLTDALNVTTEATWVKVGEITESTVLLTYEANSDAPGSAAREAVIKFAYNGAEDVLVTLKQDSETASFSVEFLNVTPQMAQYVCTPVDNEMLYLLVSSQDLGNYGVQGETPVEMMNNYAQLLAANYMLLAQPDFNFVFKGANTEMPKEASRWSAEESVTVYAVGFNATKTEEADGVLFATEAELSTAVHVWDVPFLPYPSLTIAEADLNKTVPAAAGEVVINCAIENPVEGTEVLVETEAAWVTASYADGKITLAYEANTAAVARRASIAVSYGWFTNPTEIILVQEKDANAQAITLNIEVVGTQFNGIIVNVTPSDETVTYALNQCAVEKDWETGAELAMDWIGKAEELLSYAGTATFHKGALTNHFIKMNPSYYQWNGYDYYVYGVAVDATSEGDNWTVSQILGEVAYTKTTIDASKMPSLEWDLTKTEGLVWNETNERYDLEAVEGSTVVLHFNVINPAEGAFVALNGTSLNDSYNVVDGEPVIDNAAGTVTLKIDKFDTAKKYHYVSLTFKYTNAEGDTWGITTPGLRLTQVENKGYALPYSQTFASGQGDWTIDNVDLSTLSYVWKHDASYKCMKASAYAGSAKATESWLVSPKIDLTTATAPVLTFDQAINHAKGTAATTLTLWVKEASATEWTQLTIPSYPSSDSWTFYAAGEVDLSAYVGKSIQIAYKYTSTTSIASTWEVKNVKVAEK